MRTDKAKGKSARGKAPANDVKPRKLLKGRLNAKASPAAHLSGRQRKDRAMIRAREIAAGGGYDSFAHVLSKYESENPDDRSLRIWAGGADRAEIDMICARWKKSLPKRRR